MKNVWVVYEVTISPWNSFKDTFNTHVQCDGSVMRSALPNQNRKVKAICETKDIAVKFAQHFKDTWDEKLGIDIQEWILDEEEDLCTETLK